PATFEGGRHAFEAVRRSGATAVVAFNDLQAAGLLPAAADAGVAVPAALSVVGSDGLDLAGMTSPALTTVAPPVAELGRAAVATLRHALAAAGADPGPPPPPATTTLEPHLVVRASTAPPAAAPDPRRDP